MEEVEKSEEKEVREDGWGWGEAKFTGSVCREAAIGGRGREHRSAVVPRARELGNKEERGVRAPLQPRRVDQGQRAARGSKI